MQTYPSQRRRVLGPKWRFEPRYSEPIPTIEDRAQTAHHRPVPSRGGDRQQTMMRRSTNDDKPPNDSQSWDVTNRNSPSHGTYEFTDADG